MYDINTKNVCAIPFAYIHIAAVIARVGYTQFIECTSDLQHQTSKIENVIFFALLKTDLKLVGDVCCVDSQIHHRMQIMPHSNI